MSVPVIIIFILLAVAAVEILCVRSLQKQIAERDRQIECLMTELHFAKQEARNWRRAAETRGAHCSTRGGL